MFGYELQFIIGSSLIQCQGDQAICVRRRNALPYSTNATNDTMGMLLVSYL